MAVTEPTGGSEPLKVAVKWVTSTGATMFKNLPFGGALGVVGAGMLLWLAPHLVPAGWTAEAVLSLGMGLGVVINRMVTGMLGWVLEPIRRHLGAGVEAWIRLGKVDRYRTRGLLPEKDATALAAKIAKEDVSPKPTKR